MTTLKKLNKNLKKNQDLFIDIFDTNTCKRLDKNQNAISILSNYKSFENYYKSFYEKGYLEIKVVTKIKVSKFIKREEFPINIVFR